MALVMCFIDAARKLLSQTSGAGFQSWSSRKCPSILGTAQNAQLFGHPLVVKVAHGLCMASVSKGHVGGVEVAQGAPMRSTAGPPAMTGPLCALARVSASVSSQVNGIER